MPRKDPRIDAYIQKAAPFAQPILKHVRKVVHAACPDVEETIKWGLPHFDYKGEMMCAMAAFKAHCTFGFWKGTLVSGRAHGEGGAMGQFGRITSQKDLPSDSTIARYVKTAMKLNDEGVTSPSRVRSKAPRPVVVPADLKAALAKNNKAAATFTGFSPSHKREYVEWITEAKTDATRERRLAQALEWMAEGKPRMWKYMKTRAAR
jgi:uncharacterized protein YdeI (YjbR/CyaY-like superfamily)